MNIQPIRGTMALWTTLFLRSYTQSIKILSTCCFCWLWAGMTHQFLMCVWLLPKHCCCTFLLIFYVLSFKSTLCLLASHQIFLSVTGFYIRLMTQLCFPEYTCAHRSRLFKREMSSLRHVGFQKKQKQNRLWFAEDFWMQHWCSDATV